MFECLLVSKTGDINARRFVLNNIKVGSIICPFHLNVTDINQHDSKINQQDSEINQHDSEINQNDSEINQHDLENNHLINKQTVLKT